MHADPCPAVQLELRVLAHLSGDPDLCATMRETDDPFTLMVCYWDNCTKDQVRA